MRETRQRVEMKLKGYVVGGKEGLLFLFLFLIPSTG